MKQELRIDDRSIITKRIFRHAVSKIWRMWTEPGLIALWFGPDGFSTTTLVFDFSIGGIWKFVMHGPDGRDYPNEVRFETIVVHRHIHYVKLSPPLFHTYVDFNALDENTTEIIFTQVFESPEERNTIAVYAEPANDQFMRKLDKALGGLAQ